MAQLPASRDRVDVNVTSNKTLGTADVGIVQNVAADNLTITLPAAAPGLTYTVRNIGAAAGGTIGSGSNGSAIVTLAVNGTDTMTGNNFTPAASKGAVNTKATSLVTDEITVTCGAAGNWFISNVVGTWVRQA